MTLFFLKSMNNVARSNRISGSPRGAGSGKTPIGSSSGGSHGPRRGPDGAWSAESGVPGAESEAPLFTRREPDICIEEVERKVAWTVAGLRKASEVPAATASLAVPEVRKIPVCAKAGSAQPVISHAAIIHLYVTARIFIISIPVRTWYIHGRCAE